MRTSVKLFTIVLVLLLSVSISAQIVGSKAAKKYHTKECAAVKKISADNLVEFKSVEEAKAAGYTACKICKPGMEKELKAVKEKKVKEAKTEADAAKKAALKDVKEAKKNAVEAKKDAVKDAKEIKKNAIDAKKDAVKKAKETKKEVKDAKKEVLDELKK
jgi:methylphosphotriester-DNA--protein-cysteine methyltransferase